MGPPVYMTGVGKDRKEPWENVPDGGKEKRGKKQGNKTGFLHATTKHETKTESKKKDETEKRKGRGKNSKKIPKGKHHLVRRGKKKVGLDRMVWISLNPGKRKEKSGCALTGKPCSGKGCSKGQKKRGVTHCAGGQSQKEKGKR